MKIGSLKDIFKISELSSSQLLKMGLITFIYGSPDVTFHCFKNYDEKNGTSIHKALFDLENKVKNQTRKIKRKKEE